MATDFPSTFEEKSCIKAVGADMTKNATAKIFQQTGLSPQDVQVVELHDCFSCNEVNARRSSAITCHRVSIVFVFVLDPNSSSRMRLWALLARARRPSWSTPRITPTVRRRRHALVASWLVRLLTNGVLFSTSVHAQAASGW
jgi:hypothetical protein